MTKPTQLVLADRGLYIPVAGFGKNVTLGNTPEDSKDSLQTPYMERHTHTQDSPSEIESWRQDESYEGKTGTSACINQ